MDSQVKSDSQYFTAQRISKLTKLFDDMDDKSMQEALYTIMRIYNLEKMLSTNSPAAAGDILNVWLTGNYCKSILLARYLDAASGECFDLVYNFANICLVWEHNNPEINPFARVHEVRQKLLECGIACALTPCVIADKENLKYESDEIICYDSNALFYLEAELFADEMQFAKYPAMSCMDVLSLIHFANANFLRDTVPTAEKYDPEYTMAMMDAFSKLADPEKKKIFVLYETKLFERSAWTVVRQGRIQKYIVAIRPFNSSTRSKDVETHEDNRKWLRPQTELNTIFIIPKKVKQIPQNESVISPGVFYVRIEDFYQVLCSILDNLE